MKNVYELEAYVRGQVTSLRESVRNAYDHVTKVSGKQVEFSEASYASRMLNLAYFIQREVEYFYGLKEYFKSDPVWSKVLQFGIEELNYLRYTEIEQVSAKDGVSLKVGGKDA